MVAKTFQEYRQLREGDESSSDSGGKSDSEGISTSVSLGKNNDYEPFQVSDDPKSENYGKNAALAPIVRAFKGGGNWGWSKDEGSGDDKPVKISGKKLYLSGGSVRAHLHQEKNNGPIQLATSASPDEVYHLMKQNGFEFVTDMGEAKGSSAPHPNRKEGSKQYFWVEQKNKHGRPFTFGISVNGDEFTLDTFKKQRGKLSEGDDPEPGTMGDDAASRDFTMNGMYIELGNENGQNDKLSDFHGGIHHMGAGRIVPIGGMKSMDKRPDKMIRYMRFMHGYGNPKTMSSEDKKYMTDNAHKLGKFGQKHRKYMMGEFKKGMDKEGSDCRGYLKMFKDLGMLDHLFPGKILDTEFPKELSEIGDKQAPMAWMLRNNDTDMMDDMGMDDGDLKKIKFLIKSLGMTEAMDHNQLDDLTNGFTGSGISSRKLREWGTKLGGLDGDMLDAFLAHSKSPRVKHMKMGDDGRENMDPAFYDLQDPFTGQQDHDGINERKKMLELDEFRKHMAYMKPL
jgi:hypothetical protein